MMGIRASLVLFFCLIGCGNDSEAADANGGGNGGSGGSADAATGGTAGQGGCIDDPRFRPPGGVCLEHVSGTVVDGTGAPVPALSVSVCGAVCYYGESDATGAFDVEVRAHVIPKDYSTLPHGRPDRTSFYYQLPLDAQDSIAVGELRVLDLPPTGPSLVVKSDKLGAPAQTATSGAVTLHVLDGVSVKLDVEDIAVGADGKMFRALTIPEAQRDHFAPAALGLVALYAFTPFEVAFVDATTSDSALVQLEIDNEAALPANSPVEFLGLGSYLFPAWVPPAEFQVVATGTVSADGQKLVMDTGQGIPYLTWLGVRPAPAQ
jgi:hypothetical protein